MINQLLNRARAALHSRKSRAGQTLMEYALILAFISVVAITVLLTLGKTVTGVFSTIDSQINAAGQSH